MDLECAAAGCCFAAIDFETTGSTRGAQSLPWQVGVALLYEGKVQLEPIVDALMRVPQDHPFNQHAPGKHRSCRAEIAVAPTALELWPQIDALLRPNIPVAHNIGTERTQLARLAPLSPYGPWIDTLPLIRKIYPGLSSYALEDVAAQLGLKPVHPRCEGREAHDAFYDAVMCAQLLRHVLSLEGWADARLADLVEASGTGRGWLHG